MVQNRTAAEAMVIHWLRLRSNSPVIYKNTRHKALIGMVRIQSITFSQTIPSRANSKYRANRTPFPIRTRVIICSIWRYRLLRAIILPPIASLHYFFIFIAYFVENSNGFCKKVVLHIFLQKSAAKSIRPLQEAFVDVIMFVSIT